MDRPLTGRGRTRIAGDVAIAALALALAACGGGGSGGGDVALGGSSTQTLGWGPASGPVAGYRVWVSRDGAPYEAEARVPTPSVTLRGQPGETARIMVAAFDSRGNAGPLSPPSPIFAFPDPESTATADSAAPAAGSSTTRSFAGSGGTRTAAGSDGAGSEDDVAAPVVPPSEKRAWDANGDWVADLLWESGGTLRITTAQMETQLIFTRPSSGDAAVAMGDFDGDGLADPLWVGAGGGVGYTPMAALYANPSQSPVVPLGTLGASERVVAAGDFDGDGLSDVLLHDEGDGFASMWLSNPGAPPDVAGLGAVADEAVGVADYDGDDRSDVLWRTPGGSLVVWRMGGALVLEVAEVSLPGPVEILASGDFDGDGAADVAHRDPETGVVSVLRPLVGAVEGWTSSLGDTRGWAPRGAADFDGDGTDDLLLSEDLVLRLAYLPGEERLDLDPASPWSLVPLPR